MEQTAVEKLVEEINKDLSKYFELNNEKNEEVVAGFIPTKTIANWQKSLNIKSLNFRVAFREDCKLIKSE